MNRKNNDAPGELDDVPDTVAADLDALREKAAQLAAMEGATIYYDVRRARSERGTSAQGWETVGRWEGDDVPDAHDIGVMVRRAGTYQVIARAKWRDGDGRLQRRDVALPLFYIGPEYERPLASAPASAPAPAPAAGIQIDPAAMLGAGLSLLDKLADISVKLGGGRAAEASPAASMDAAAAMMKSFQKMTDMQMEVMEARIEKLRERLQDDDDDRPRRDDDASSPSLIEMGSAAIDLFERFKKAGGAQSGGAQ